MQYGFDTEDVSAATGALLVYAIWRSRDKKRFKIDPDCWAKCERFVKASAKRAESIPRFIEALKPRLCCDTIHPRWMEAGIKGLLPLANRDGSVSYLRDADAREFLTGVLNACDEKLVLERLYKETAWAVLLCRDRLEREKPMETAAEETVNVL